MTQTYGGLAYNRKYLRADLLQHIDNIKTKLRSTTSRSIRSQILQHKQECYLINELLMIVQENDIHFSSEASSGLMKLLRRWEGNYHTQEEDYD